MVENRLDEAERFFADEYVRIDRRSGVAAPEARGGRAFLGAWRGFFEVGFSRQYDACLAVRGERLHLIRSRFETSDGREVEFLQVVEFDEAGRASAGVNFDVDDLSAALEELDARYLASGEATDVEQEVLAGAAMLNRRDYEAFTARLSPDFVTIDHSPLGFPPADRDAFVHEHMAGLDAMVPDNVRIVGKLFAAGDTVLFVSHVVGTTTEGSEYEWTPVFIARRSPDGLIDRIEAFQRQDWDAALTRFDELAAASARTEIAVEPAIARLVTQFYDDAVAMFATSGDVQAFAARWFADDVLRVDRRTGVSMPDVSGRDAYAEVYRATGETFDNFAPEYLASRGEQLGLVRMTLETDGFEIAYLIVVEFDDAGQATHFVHFDPDDLAGAFQELEDRYCAGDGAADAYTIRRIGDLVRARDRRDWDGLTDVIAPDLVAADHRLLPYPLSGRESYVAMQQGVVDLAPDVSLELRTLDVRGDAVMARVLSRGTSADGSLATWEFWNVGRFAAGKLAAVDFYDLADEGRARAHLEKLAAADPRTPVLDNDAIRQMVRLLWIARFDFDRSVEMFSPDVVLSDRRGVIGLPTLTGIEAMGFMYTSIFAVYDDMTGEPVAERGERLALFGHRMSTEGGSESVAYMLVGLDGEGRIDVMVSFDENDLAGTLEELERRHKELSGDTYFAVERTYARASTALARGDMEAWQSCQARDVKVIDHSLLGVGELDGEGTSDHLTVWRDQTPDFVSYRTRSFVRADAMLSALAIRGTTPEGNRYEWDCATVARVDAAGLLAEEHFFPVEQWDAARALFDEWSQPPELEAAEPPAGATGLSNRATRAQDAYNAAFATRDWDAMAASYTDEIVNDDRRTGVSWGSPSGASRSWSSSAGWSTWVSRRSRPFRSRSAVKDSRYCGAPGTRPTGSTCRCSRSGRSTPTVGRRRTSCSTPRTSRVPCTNSTGDTSPARGPHPPDSCCQLLTIRSGPAAASGQPVHHELGMLDGKHLHIGEPGAAGVAPHRVGPHDGASPRAVVLHADR